MNKLSPQAVFDFMKVYYEVMGIIITYEQAEEEANRFMRILVLTFPSDKIRTVKALTKRRVLNTKRGKKTKSQV